MRGTRWVAAGLAGLVLAAAAAPEVRGEGLQPGLWRTAQSVRMNGVRQPPRETMRCLTPAEVADPDRTFGPVSRTTNSECEQVEHDLTPARFRWRLQCRGQLDMDVAGEFRFESAERYTAIITANSSMLGKPMQEVITVIDAERVGECQ